MPHEQPNSVASKNESAHAGVEDAASVIAGGFGWSARAPTPLVEREYQCAFGTDNVRLALARTRVADYCLQ
jgi:hypothetical protein